MGRVNAMEPVVAKPYGIGVSGDLLGVPTGHVMYRMTRDLAFQGVFAVFSEERDGDDEGRTALMLGGGVIYTLIDAGATRLNAVGSFGFGVGDVSMIRLDGMLRPEYFINRSLAFHVQTGLSVMITGEDGFPGQPADATVFSLFSNASLLGQAGVTFYF